MLKYIAKKLGATPILKKEVKKMFYKIGNIFGFFFIDDEKKILTVNEIFNIEKETFFGYYGHKIKRNNKIIFHILNDNYVDIVVGDISSREYEIIGTSYSFNLQQGAKLNWLDDDCIIYNVYDKEKDIISSMVYNIKTKVSKPIDSEYNEVLKDGFLIISYNKLSSVNSEYGYKFKNLNGRCKNKIDYFSFNSGEIKTLLSSECISQWKSTGEYDNVFNHILVSPKGDKFVFIERFKILGKRKDRLFLVTINDNVEVESIKILLDQDMVSHLCWVNNDKLFGYFRFKGIDSYYNLNVSGEITEVKREISKMRDGHPVYINDKFILTDTYPDFFRMQHLILLNIEDDVVKKLISLKSPLKYQNEIRCDFHPRISDDYVFFDAVIKNKRSLCIGILNIDDSTFENKI